MKIKLGWKTLLGSIAAGAILVAKGQGWLDPSTADTLLGGALAFAGIGARAAIGQVQAQLEEGQGDA